MPLSIIILAAGRGVRMCSNKPKVLHLLAGKPLLEHVFRQAENLAPAEIFCVVGHEQNQIKEALGHYPVNWIVQAEQRGTGHAVMQVLPVLNPEHQVLVLYGDVPLIQSDTLQKQLATLHDHVLSLLVATVVNPEGLGRIVRESTGKLSRVVEEKDAAPEEKKIREINTGVLAAQPGVLQRWLPCVTAQNNQHEYYLPDVINLAAQAGESVATCVASAEKEVLGVNNRLQLASLERVYQKNLAEKLLLSGVSLADPSRLDVRGELQVAEDVHIESNVLFEGHVSLGAGTQIGPNNYIRETQIAKNVVIKANCVIEGALIEEGCVVGPFARIRPGTVLKKQAHIGNFVEVKKTIVGEKSKANHLSYLGDAIIGRGVNVGAGTITCNYDGVNKYQTMIEDGVFIGSNTSLVAPIRIGMNATIGAGSTVTKEVPGDVLTVARGRQVNIPGWKRKTSTKKGDA
ncbi:MAG: bifunctional UDP-N-acetylglucosamine diphosphorylase/glucosamine-1-phosphate N-acetyltransferase GlmU [Gammaproteobacteria bacterium]|nr:bifunctional UDP-N-acetylglucosamine diphosphorylase/glucosamine-1-phosphate N-acetyltransferase GlmU [Gammaproteobacteria bacterium]